jgi:hypothetical protein
VATAVITMSSFRVAPQEGHLDRLRCKCGYLYKFKSGCLRIRTNEPDYSSLPTKEYKWSRTCYRGAKEEIPHDIQPPKGKQVVLTSYVDANLLHCVVTGKAVTASLHMVNQTVISWSSRKQETVETAMYFSQCNGRKPRYG